MKNCPAPQCSHRIPDENTACILHWLELPYTLREKLKKQQHHQHNYAVQFEKAKRIWQEKRAQV